LGKKRYAKFNSSKSKVLTINCTSQHLPNLTLNCEVLEEFTSYKYLGLTLNKTLSWRQHINNICTKAKKLTLVLLKLSKTIPKTALLKLYTCYIRSVLEYGSVIFDNCSMSDSNKREKTQMRAAKIILGCFRTTSHLKVRSQLALPPLEVRRKISLLTHFIKY